MSLLGCDDLLRGLLLGRGIGGVKGRGSGSRYQIQSMSLLSGGDILGEVMHPFNRLDGMMPQLGHGSPCSQFAAARMMNMPQSWTLTWT
jgi:hypothetical protein